MNCWKVIVLLVLLTGFVTCISRRRSINPNVVISRMTNDLVDLFLSRDVSTFLDSLSPNFEFDICRRTVYRDEFISLLLDAVKHFPEGGKIVFQPYGVIYSDKKKIFNFTIHTVTQEKHLDLEFSMELDMNAPLNYRFLYVAIANCYKSRHGNLGHYFIKP